MNKKKSIWSGVSVLIAAVLAIVAFVRSDTQIWLLTAAFTIWAIWVTAAFVFPYIQEQENEKRRAARRAAYDAQRQSLRALSVEEEDGFGPLLLRHVNHRISAYLKAVYPDATWEFPKLKDTTTKPTLTLLPNKTILEVNPMKRLISCEYNFDNCCVELKFTDGSMIAIDTIAVENEVADNMYQRSELDYLIYNAPLEYADLILNGDPETYLKTVTEYKTLDN